MFLSLLLLGCTPSSLPGSQAAPGTPGTPPDTLKPFEPADSDDPEDPPEDPYDPPTEPDFPPVDHSSSACTLGAHDRVFTVSLQSGGVSRSARVHLPVGYDGTQKLPLVLNFHGLLMSSSSHRAYTGMAGSANARGWIAVHPDAAPEWNVLPNSPDVDFVEDLLDELAATVCVAEDQVYSTGLSQGGHVSYMLGCEIPGRIAAIAPVAGSDFTVFCPSGPPVPNLHIHGTDDLIVSYNGGILYDSAPEVTQDWANRMNGCSATPVVTLQQGNVTCETRSCRGDDDTVLCSVNGGGHTWPGADPLFWLGNTTNAIDANEVILDFFAQHTR